MDMNTLLRQAKRVHFVGIGGSGMSPLAEILHEKGYALQGSDNNESDNLKRIRALHIPVTMGHAAANIDGADLLVYTNAVGESNPELKEARKRGIPVLERAELLGLITRQYSRTVSVAGTHGKTSTTSMIAQILLQAEKDPSLFIGGKLPLINANGRAGKSDIMVCEACEFLDHYLKMSTAIGIILNVDADHLDYFGSLDGVIASFHTFAQGVTDTLIVNAADENTRKAIDGVTGKTIITFNADGADWQATDVHFDNRSRGQYTLLHKGKAVTAVSLGVPGAHNVGNSLAAAAAAYCCGCDYRQIAAGLAAFTGAGRRFEFLGEVNGVTVADDYAHHPTEIEATLKTAKNMGFNRVIAVFQPFTFSRTARHLDGFVRALSLADIAIVSDIMGSREINTFGVSSEQITGQISGAQYIPDFASIADYVARTAQKGDLVLTMGGGDVYKCARMILQQLA